MPPETSTVQFIENHLPPLQAGKYQLEISQTLKIEQKLQEPYKQSKTFYVGSDRFTLPLQSIHSQFPPESSTGDYGTALPHLVLNRSTLPWEQTTGSDRTIPWLALLLFHESDNLAEPEKTTFKAASEDSRFQLGDRLLSKSQELQEHNEKISLIKIPEHLLNKIIPTPDELKLLTHVRQVSRYQGAELEKTELAIVIGNRLPKPGRNTVHLVSLENYFCSQSLQSPYFVSLKSWEFQSEKEGSEHRFRSLLMNLDSKLKNSLEENTLRRPRQDGNDDAEQFLSQGCVPLPHHLRNGQNTLSWYRSPLLPGQNSASLPSALFPIRAADRLLRYLTEIEMFDVSYAAAYQLGQLLALQDKAFLANLYTWKRQQSRSQQTASDSLAVLFDDPTESDSEAVPEKVKAWFEEAALLKHLPFNYLVPDPLMLPEESIRFFWVDPLWLNCFNEGAFGIGENWNSNEADKQRDSTNKTNAIGDRFNRVMTGFLMRSIVVSEFPAVNVKGLGQKEEPLSILRKENLSDTVLICLFEGEVRSLNITMGAEIIHFGLDRDQQTFAKALRSPQNDSIPLKENSWKDQEKLILNVAQFSQQLSLTNPNAANFGLTMVESSPQIVFKLREKQRC